MGVQVELVIRASTVDVVEERFLVSGASVEVIDHFICDLRCLSGVHDCFRGLRGRGNKSRVDCLVRRSKKSEGPPPRVGHTKLEQGRKERKQAIW